MFSLELAKAFQSPAKNNKIKQNKTLGAKLEARQTFGALPYRVALEAVFFTY